VAAPQEYDSSIFDFSQLPPADVQFLVVSDTHYLLPDNAQTAEWSSVNEFPARTERALKMAGAIPHDFAVHLGDVSHEYPETGRALVAWRAALEQFRAHGLHFHQAAGNMDIGDKPDPTSPAGWVSPETLQTWHGVFGPTWHSFDHGDIHGIVLNTQIMNGPLPEAQEQRHWAEQDLASQTGRRVLLFLHMPVFFVDRDEQALGFYNSLDEPARSWILKLIESYGIELVFAGHTHFVALNRVGSSRLYVAPSTATSRAGLAEAFTSPSPDRGRGDIDKLGFYLVRMDSDGASVHLIRTGRDSQAVDPANPSRNLITRISRELPGGRIGVMSSHPLGHVTPGPVIWPAIVRQPMRDDWRLLACTEIGARNVRVPASDLVEPTERLRLAALRDESVEVVPYWLWTERIDVAADVLAQRDAIDGAEIVLPGEVLPSSNALESIGRLRSAGLKVSLSTALHGAAADGEYHQRTRVGYLPHEVRDVATLFKQHGAWLDRVACRLDPGQPVWHALDDFRAAQSEQIGAFDFYLDFNSEDDALNAKIVAEAVAAVSTLPDSRLVIGPLVDLDRSMDVAHGLLDRLSNPRPAFHVARCLNTLFFSVDTPIELVDTAMSGNRQVTGLLQGRRRLWLQVSDRFAAPEPYHAMTWERVDQQPGTLYDLIAGLSTRTDSEEDYDRALSRTASPVLYVAD
jgi:hypothetical protein